MVQRQVIVRDAGHQLLDELDATDIPDLSASYDAAGAAATAATDAASALSTHAGAADPHTGYALESALGTLATQSGTFSGTSSGTNTGDQTLSDATISTTDITTNNVSTSKHGFAPKAPNDATKFLDGTGAYAVPPGTGLTNPMTTAADLIVGGASGVPARLAKGADGTVLTVDPTTHLLVWTAPSGGGAPTDATYLVTASNAGLSAEVVVPAAVLTVLDDTTVAAMVDTLGGVSSTGTGGLVRATSPTLVTPALGTPASGVATNLTGTAASLTAGNVTTNANLTGDVTSSGNATTIGAAKVTGAMVAGWPSIPTKLSAALNLDRTFMQQSANVGAATRTVVGMVAGPANSGTITSGDDTDGPWQTLTTGSSSNNEATMYTATIFRRDWGAMAFGTFKTPASLVTEMFNMGFVSGALNNADVPGVHCAIFRYKIGTDGTAFWRTVTNDAGTGTVSTTTVAVTAATVYRWAVRLLASSVEYYMGTADGAMSLLVTETTTLPAATTLLAVLTRVLTLEAVAKSMQWGRHTIVMRT